MSRFFLRLLVAGRLLSLSFADLQAATVPPNPASASYQQGASDRAAWEGWYGNLTGTPLAGASFWAAERSKANAACASHANSGDDWLYGCTAARMMLSVSDVKRKSDAQYWNGWNKIVPPADPTGTAVPPPRNEETRPSPEPMFHTVANEDVVECAAPDIASRMPEILQLSPSMANTLLDQGQCYPVLWGSWRRVVTVSPRLERRWVVMMEMTNPPNGGPLPRGWFVAFQLVDKNGQHPTLN